MTDNLTPAQRHKTMAAVRSKETKIEVKLRSALHGLGFRFRKNDKRLPGTPDVFLPKYRAVILVHGCFWHGHPGCKKASLPTTRTDYWVTKIARNMRRDKETLAKLHAMGLRTAVVWECSIKNKKVFAPTVHALGTWIVGDDLYGAFSGPHSQIISNN